MSDNAVVRLEPEAREVLDKIIELQRFKVTLTAMVSQLIYDEWERTNNGNEQRSNRKRSLEAL